MNDIIFVENSIETILADTIAKMEEKLGYKLSPADVERILCDVMAYRESLLRGEMERVIRQNFVQTAIGTNLDYWGELFGVIRLTNEADDDYRQRIIANASSVANGTRTKYTNTIKAVKVDNTDATQVLRVADVILESKQDDTTLPPGMIRIHAIQSHVDTRGVTLLSSPSDTMKSAILTALSDKKQALIGDMFVVEDVESVQVSGTMVVTKALASSTSDVQASILYYVDSYFGGLGFADFGKYDLEREVKKATGLASLVSFNFDNYPTKTTKQFYVKGTISITIN